MAASLVLPVYVHEASRFSPTVGAMGGGSILLLWAYLLTLSVLVGAQVRVAIWDRTGQLDDPDRVSSSAGPADAGQLVS